MAYYNCIYYIYILYLHSVTICVAFDNLFLQVLPTLHASSIGECYSFGNKKAQNMFQEKIDEKCAIIVFMNLHLKQLIFYFVHLIAYGTLAPGLELHVQFVDAFLKK